MSSSNRSYKAVELNVGSYKPQKQLLKSLASDVIRALVKIWLASVLSHRQGRRVSQALYASKPKLSSSQSFNPITFCISFTAMATTATPRILPSYLSHFHQKVVMLLGTISSMHGDSAQLRSCNNETVTLILNR
jgi:Replication factor A protein 3